MPDEVMEECSISFAEARSLDDVVNNLDKTFMELVFSFADEKGMSVLPPEENAGALNAIAQHLRRIGTDLTSMAINKHIT